MAERVECVEHLSTAELDECWRQQEPVGAVVAQLERVRDDRRLVYHTDRPLERVRVAHAGRRRHPVLRTARRHVCTSTRIASHSLRSLSQAFALKVSSPSAVSYGLVNF